MLKLLNFEFRRLFRRTSLYVCLGVVAVPVLFMFLIVGMEYFDKNYQSSITMYSVIQQMIAVANLSTLVVVFTSIFGCEDRTRGTVKTIYSLGYPRAKLFLAKFIASASAAAMMYALVAIIGVICGAVFSKQAPVNSSYDFGDLFGLYNQEQPDIILYIVQQFFVIMGAHAFYFMIAELMNKTGLAIVLSIFGPGLVSSGFGIMTGIMSALADGNQKLIEEIQNMYFTFMQYWLPTSFGSLTTLFGGFVQVNLWISILVNIGYIILFGGLAMLITYKKQIK